MEEVALQATFERRGWTKDEGLTLMAQMLLMAQCEAFSRLSARFHPGFSSNVGVLVHDLMHARRIDEGRQLHALDIGRSPAPCTHRQRGVHRHGERPAC